MSRLIVKRVCQLVCIPILAGLLPIRLAGEIISETARLVGLGLWHIVESILPEGSNEESNV